jgi:hypothetical protein
MKLVTATFATAILLAVSGAAAPASHAQDQQQQDKTHPKQQEKPTHPQQEEKPAHPQQQTKPAHPQQPAQHQQQRQVQHQQQQAQHQQQQEQKQQQKSVQDQQKQQEKVQKAQQQEQRREQNASRPQPTRTQRAQQAPMERGGQPARGNPQQTAHYEQAHFRRYTPQNGERVVRIPDPQFHQYFGRDHRFSIGVEPVIVGGFPRFQYSGFWFVLEEPWPGYWVYGDPDFYILFTDGNYWLCNYDDPGVQIELTVVVV